MRKSKRKVKMMNNPGAGKNTPRAGLGRVLGGILTTPVHVYEPKDQEEIKVLAQEICRDGETDIVAIAGGDGTLHHHLTQHIDAHRSEGKALPLFLLLPVGTMNNVATSVGITRYHPLDFAKRIRTKIEKDRPFDVVHVHVLKINGEYGFFYGAGLPVNFLKKYYEGDKKRGPAGAIRLAVRTLLQQILSFFTLRKPKHGLFDEVHGLIKFPEGTDPPVAPNASHTGILAGTVDQIGLGASGLPQAMTRPGNFMIRSTRLGFWGLIWNLGNLWAGWPLRKTYDAVVPKVTISYTHPTEYTVDGELKEACREHVVECSETITLIVG